MFAVAIFLLIILGAYVVITSSNDRRKEAKGICKTTGSSCTSPTGCTCGEQFERHEH